MPQQSERRPAPANAGAPSTETTFADAVPGRNPVIEETQALLNRGEYRSAVLAAFRAAFRDTVRAYALSVPDGCTNRRFLREFLRPDMGKLTTLLPELHEKYEPVRYGQVNAGDAATLLALVERVYGETSLGIIYRPGYLPTGPARTPVVAALPPRFAEGRTGQ